MHSDQFEDNQRHQSPAAARAEDFRARRAHTSALPGAKKAEGKTRTKEAFRDFQHMKLLREVPEEIIASQTAGLMAPLITGQGCSCCAEEHQGCCHADRLATGAH